ncbi:sugar phosphate isomerase/epimerase family protein [Pedobacter zeae]|uniref:Sugar phosphate isomerase/epimerase n=1 Tax=Pedobacter zeae TaxID=1737356 RepID=A0A7W6P911_9SPHI|nr:sugar phosphate isomerase/epimerase [Pedobacter zeae]MBB4110544.1 sugar phosphate isomerase/epimerase [Pedobacter zeae]GGH18541.1 xylose isomerase [Pedobacter zeae]
MMNSRRTFLKQAGLAAGAAFLIPSFAFDKASKNVGIQLYSLRGELPKDVKGVIEKVAQAGYKEVETYGFSNGKFWGLTPKEFKALLDANGLKAPSGHYGMDDFSKTGKTDKLKADIESSAAIGGKYFTIAGAHVDTSKGIDGFKKTADDFNKVAEIAKASGLKFAYHNHDFEFKKLDGTTGYDVYLSETDKNLVNFEMDLYWVVRSGNDPLALFKKYPGRFPMWHVKDMDKTKPEWNTEVGQGSVDFKTIFAQAKLSGMQHFFVEQETNYKPDPIGSIKTSCDYIKANLV